MDFEQIETRLGQTVAKAVRAESQAERQERIREGNRKRKRAQRLREQERGLFLDGVIPDPADEEARQRLWKLLQSKQKELERGLDRFHTEMDARTKAANPELPAGDPVELDKAIRQALFEANAAGFGCICSDAIKRFYYFDLKYHTMDQFDPSWRSRLQTRIASMKAANIFNGWEHEVARRQATGEMERNCWPDDKPLLGIPPSPPWMLSGSESNAIPSESDKSVTL